MTNPIETDGDEERLNLLGIFHYVVGGLGVLFACFPLIHFGVGLAIVLDTFPEGQGDHPPQWFGLTFVVVGGVMFLIGQALAWTTVYSGSLLRRCKNRMFSFVVACVLCASSPSVPCLAC